MGIITRYLFFLKFFLVNNKKSIVHIEVTYRLKFLFTETIDFLPKDQWLPAPFYLYPYFQLLVQP